MNLFTFIGLSCRNKVTKFLAKEFATLSDAEEFYNIDYVTNSSDFKESVPLSTPAKPATSDVDVCLSPIFSCSPHSSKLKTLSRFFSHQCLNVCKSNYCNICFSISLSGLVEIHFIHLSNMILLRQVFLQWECCMMKASTTLCTTSLGVSIVSMKEHQPECQLTECHLVWSTIMLGFSQHHLRRNLVLRIIMLYAQGV